MFVGFLASLFSDDTSFVGVLAQLVLRVLILFSPTARKGAKRLYTYASCPLGYSVSGQFRGYYGFQLYDSWRYRMLGLDEGSQHTSAWLEEIRWKGEVSWSRTNVIPCLHGGGDSVFLCTWIHRSSLHLLLGYL